MLVYCDYIMNLIRNRMLEAAGDSMAPLPVQGVGRTMFDVDADGSFVSPTKRLEVKVNGKWYLITVEEKL